MGRTQVTKIVGRCVATVGIILALILAGGAPSSGMYGPSTTTLVGK